MVVASMGEPLKWIAADERLYNMIQSELDRLGIDLAFR